MDKNREKLIDHAVSQYNKRCLWLVSGATLLIFLYMSVKSDMTLVNEVVSCAVLTLVCNFVCITAWKAVAKTSWERLTMFYLMASVVRFLVMLSAVLIACVVLRVKALIMSFIIILFIYYLIMLIFESVFFVKVEKMQK